MSSQILSCSLHKGHSPIKSEREKKEDRLKDDCEVRADLSLNWEEKRKKENEIMASRSYQVLSLPSVPL
jgi:hypothetical protein